MTINNSVYVAKVWIKNEFYDGSDCVEEFIAEDDEKAKKYITNKYGEDKLFFTKKKE